MFERLCSSSKVNQVSGKTRKKEKGEENKSIYHDMHLNPHPAISVVVVLLPSALAVLAHINKHAVNKR